MTDSLRPEVAGPQRTVELVLANLGLDAKIAQLSCGGRAYEMDDLFDEAGELDGDRFSERFPHGVGQIGRMSLDRDPAVARHNTMAIQELLTELAPQGIGTLFNEEGVHGLMGRDATVFPSALALAATWDCELVEQVYTAVALEARWRGSNYVYAPVLDLARDPRWGRVEETFGEDPCLVSELGVAAVHGLQGRSGYRIAADRVLACAKHFVGHGVPQSGANAGPAQLGERELREDHLAPFGAVIERAGVGAIMAGYHEIDGVPAHVDDHLLHDVLRTELDFEGFVSSDGFGIQQLATLHRVATDPVDAARQAFEAGIDCEVPVPVGTSGLADLVRQGVMSESIIDRAVRRVLTAKDRLGLLGPTPVEPVPFSQAQYDAHVAFSCRVGRAAAVLMTNNGLLPLDSMAYETLVVAGPNAEHAHLGGYTDPGASGISVLDGIRERFSGTQVTFVEGCRISDQVVGAATWWANDVHRSDPTDDDDRIHHAAVAAGQAELAVVVIGGNEATHREGWWFDHLGDRDDLTLPGRQNELVERIAATGTPVVAVVISPGPVDLARVAAAADAVLWTCYPGEQGGRALAQVLAGDCDPEGRLPVTFPRSTGQIPVFAGRRPSAGRNYLNRENSALFPLGHGLSYTSFSTEVVAVKPKTISVQDLASGATVDLEIRITNTGARPGVEHVRVTIDDELASVTRSRHRLVAFRTCRLEPGASTTLRMSLGERQFSLIDRTMRRVVEPGTFGIGVHSSTSAPLRAPSKPSDPVTVVTVAE